MGQEQSAEITPISTYNAQTGGRTDPGVIRVEGTGTAIRHNVVTTEADELAAKSAVLPLPQPLLPPSEVEDTITSALQGANVIQELRMLFDGLMVGVEGTSTSLSQAVGLSSSKTADDKILTETTLSAANKQETEITEQTDSPSFQNEQKSALINQIGIDPQSLDKIIAACTGGHRMTNVVERQKNLLAKMSNLQQLTNHLKSRVENNREQARQVTKAIEQLDRIGLSVSDLHEQLEQVIATTNILGASHFVDDEEMCSFKNFLKYNPPKIE